MTYEQWLEEVYKKNPAGIDESLIRFGKAAWDAAREDSEAKLNALEGKLEALETWYI